MAALTSGVALAQTAPSTKPTVDTVLGQIATLSFARGNGDNDEIAANDRRRSQQALVNIQEALDRQDYSSAAQLARSTTSQMRTAPFREVWLTLQPALAATASKGANEIADEFKQFVAAAPEAIQSAKSSEDLDPLALQLRRMQQRIERRSNSGDDRAAADLTREQVQYAIQSVENWRPVVEAEAAEDYGRALGAIRNFEGNDRRGPLLPRAFVTAKRKALQEKADAQFDASIKGVREAVAVAKTAAAVEAALAPLRERLESTQNSPYGSYGNGANALQVELVAGTAYASALRNEAEGKPRAALASLQNGSSGAPQMMRRGSPARIIPEEMLAVKIATLQKMIASEATDIREPEVKAAAEPVSAAQDLAGFVAATAQANNFIGDSTRIDNRTLAVEFQSAAADAVALSRMDSLLAANQYGPFWQFNSQFASQGGALSSGSIAQPHRWRDRVNAFRLDLIRRAILASAPFAAKAADGETPDKLLLRIADESAKRGDYAGVLRALQTYSVAFYTPTTVPAWLSADLLGVNAYLAGSNFDRAGQVTDAASQYLAALALTGPHVPTESIIERMKSLRAADPKAVDSAKPAAPVASSTADDRFFRPASSNSPTRNVPLPATAP